MSATTHADRPMVEQLHRLVASNRARWRRLLLLELAGLAVAAPLAYLLLFLFLDTQWHLPAWGRLLVGIGFVAAVLALLLRGVLRWRALHWTEDAVALAVERRTAGGVQNRLINAVQLARDDSSELGRAVVEENYERLQQMALQHAGPARPALLYLGLAALVLGAGAAFWLLQPEQFANAAARMLHPFTEIDPIYRTVLRVEPGDIEAAGDVTIRVTVNGELPETLTVLSNVQGRRGAQIINAEDGALFPGAPTEPVLRPLDLSGWTGGGGVKASDRKVRVVKDHVVTYTFHGVEQSMTYAVKGGDFTSKYYRIDVPTPALLSMVRASFRFPSYTNLPERQVERAGGDLEALRGTVARVTFVFDQPADEATLILERARKTLPDLRVIARHLLPAATLIPLPSTPPEELTKRIPLQRISPTEYAGELVFEDVVGYQLETRQAGRKPHRSPTYVLRVLADQEPRLDLAGLERQTAVQVDSRLPLKITATDDYGLEKVGLFARRPNAVQARSASKGSGQPLLAPRAHDEDGWEALAVWDAKRQTSFRQSFELDVGALKVSEGERVEIVLRGSDTDPLKEGRWSNGTVFALLVGGEGAALQVQYEQILRSEAELKALLDQQKKLHDRADEWVRKLDGEGGLRWDDMKNIDALHAAVKEQSGTQEKVRQLAGRIARDMVPQAGNLRVGVGMLADTEMVRAGRALDSVPTQEQPQNKRKALADVRAAQQRTVRSLEEITEQYAAFRQEWELANMIPFVQMLAERQTKLATQSRQYAEQPADKRAPSLPDAVSRRQTKILELCGLIRPAFTGLAERLKASEKTLADAFSGGAVTLASVSLTGPMKQAAEDAKAGRWTEAAQQQAAAAKELADLHARLRKAQIEAAHAVLKALQEKAKSDLAAQKLLEKLNPGNPEKVLTDVAADLKIEEIIHAGEVAAKKNDGENEVKTNLQKYSEGAMKLLDTGNPGEGQKFDVLKLADTPEKGSIRYPHTANRENNKVKPFIHEKFDDLVGKLLEEADDLTKKYDTLTLNYRGMHGDPGEIGKQGGSLNSTSADSPTGNQKPNINHSAGVSRAGRQGARAGGMVVGEESINRRGRDKVMEGHERVPDVDGMLKEKPSDDMQKETSTGIGGKKVDSQDNKFSLSDAGKWTDDMAKRMGEAQKKNNIVERADGRLDPRVAEMMRDLESKQEQVIERIKTVKKELRNLYLPADHLDEAIRELENNLAMLKERPDAELFRQQVQALERLHGAVRVFRGVNAGFQASLPREQAVRGRVLDEPARPALPGYEEAVKNYYEKLAAQ